MDKVTIINKVKGAANSLRTVRIRPTGIFATRALILVILIPILLVVFEFVYAVVSGYVSDDVNRLISVGINIIDHIFIPSVLTTLVGFLALWIDKDNNGIPDKLEGGNDNGESIYQSRSRRDP